MAIYEIGCFFGAIFAFLFGERLGRRWSIILGCMSSTPVVGGNRTQLTLSGLVLSVGAIIQATAYGIPQMIVGRIVAGLGNGLNTATIRTFTGPHSQALWLLTLYSCVALRAYEAYSERPRSVDRAGHQYFRGHALLLDWWVSVPG